MTGQFWVRVGGNPRDWKNMAALYFPDQLINNIYCQQEFRIPVNRGFSNDSEDIAENKRMTAVEKAATLKILLGAVAPPL